MRYIYLIDYYDDFANTFRLYYAPAGTAIPAGMERISRKEAEHKARHERYTRKNNPAFAYRGDAYIWPLSAPAYIAENEWIARDDNYSYIDGCRVHLVRDIPNCYK